MLDSTDAGAIRAIEEAIDLERDALPRVDRSRAARSRRCRCSGTSGARRPDGRAFVAITDPGSGLEELASEHGFRRTFLNDPNIGGRYSALSYFGLVPAALMGADVEGLLDRAGIAEQNCLTFDAADANSGLWLGLAWASSRWPGATSSPTSINPPLQSFGLWVEQLLAESTGKGGKGIVPVVDEPLGEPDVYGDDRTLVYLRHAEAATRRRRARRRRSPKPVFR